MHKTWDVNKWINSCTDKTKSELCFSEVQLPFLCFVSCNTKEQSKGYTRQERWMHCLSPLLFHLLFPQTAPLLHFVQPVMSVVAHFATSFTNKYFFPFYVVLHSLFSVLFISVHDYIQSNIHNYYKTHYLLSVHNVIQWPGPCYSLHYIRHSILLWNTLHIGS